jgi:hypothetical protein
MAVERLTVAKMLGLTSVPTLKATEEASQSFKRGDPLIDGQTDGWRVEIAGTEPVGSIVGIANEDASGVEGTEIDYIPAMDGIIFEGNIGTSVSAGAIAETDMFQKYPLQLSGSDWFIDKTDNTNPSVMVVGFKDPVGTVNGRVYFRFLADVMISDT